MPSGVSLCVPGAEVLASLAANKAAPTAAAAAAPDSNARSAGDLLDAQGRGEQGRPICPPHRGPLWPPGAEVCGRASGDSEGPRWTFSGPHPKCNTTEAPVRAPLSPPFSLHNPQQSFHTLGMQLPPPLLTRSR